MAAGPVAEMTSSEVTKQSPLGQKKKRKKKRECHVVTRRPWGWKKRGTVALAKKKERALCQKGDRWRESMVSMSVTWLFDSCL